MTRAAWIAENLHGEAVRAPYADRPSALTVGLEIEAFLLDTAGRAASHVASQALLHRVGREPEWSCDATEDTALGRFLPAVRRAEMSGGASILKYDHHPHLLELALGPFPDLLEAAEAAERTFGLLQRHARALDLTARLQPHLPGYLPQSPLPLFRSLRATRRRNRDRAGRPRNRPAENYAAGIAALQLHVGGLNWASRPDWIGRLYGFEPALLAQGVARIGGSAAQRARLLRRRWAGYRNAFPLNPLIGFPDLSAWSLETWALALADAPLLDDEAGTHSDAETSWPVFRERVRDLQIVRPRSFGTVEFRADPVQPTIAANLRLAALRLGLCASLFTAKTPTPDFRTARDLWWSRAMAHEDAADDDGLLRLARQGLDARGLGEAGLLDG